VKWKRKDADAVKSRTALLDGIVRESRAHEMSTGKATLPFGLSGVTQAKAFAAFRARARVGNTAIAFVFIHNWNGSSDALVSTMHTPARSKFPN